MAFKILSLSGGGVRGIFQAHYLHKVSEILEEPDLFSSFNLIAGTSTGAIVGLALALGVPLEEIVELFKANIPKIFKRNDKFARYIQSLAGSSLYDPRLLEEALISVFPKDKLLKDCQPVVITAAKLHKFGHHIFTNVPVEGKVSPDASVPIIDVAMASSAAPIYFLPRQINTNTHVGTYLDGGLWANSPSLPAVLTAHRYLGIELTDIRLVNLGSGHWPKGITATNWGKIPLIRKIPPLLDAIFDSQKDFSDNFLEHFLGIDYICEIDDDLPQKIDLDDADLALEILPSLAHTKARQTAGGLQNFLEGKEKRTRYKKIPAIKTISLWSPQNHSYPEVEFVDLFHQTGKLKLEQNNLTYQIKKGDILNILENHYKNDIDVGSSIKINTEDTGSLNFQVINSQKEPLLLRIHKRQTDSNRLNVIFQIVDKIFDSETFKDSGYNECLKPIATSSADARYIYYDFDNARFTRLVSAFKFAENVQHFNGRHPEQIASLASKFGSIQKTLRGLPPQLCEKLDDLSDSRTYLHWFQDKDETKSFFKLLCQANDFAQKGNNKDHPIILLFKDKLEVITKAFDEVLGSIEFGSNENFPSLNDLHPHNTFFNEKNECVLIYDYETVSRKWPVTNAVAFSMHRFIREYISILQEFHTYNYDSKNKIREQVELFTEHYYEASDEQMPRDFYKRISLEIKFANISKLLSIMAFFHNLMRDAAQRSNETYVDEFIKFVTYIEEADHFSLNN